MGLITKADDERLDRTKGLSYPSEAVLVASLRAALEEIDIIKSLHYAKSPCGHSSQYAFTEDGGKNIVCLQCSRAALRADLAAALAQLAENEGQVCQMREKLKVACQWLLSAEAITTVGLERAFHDINTVAPCRAIAVAAYLKEGK